MTIHCIMAFLDVVLQTLQIISHHYLVTFRLHPVICAFRVFVCVLWPSTIFDNTLYFAPPNFWSTLCIWLSRKFWLHPLFQLLLVFSFYTQYFGDHMIFVLTTPNISTTPTELFLTTPYWTSIRNFIRARSTISILCLTHISY